LIDANVSTKYKDREKTIDDIIDDSNVVLNTNKGNYIIFFPSYKYMELFLEKFKNDEYQIIAQESDLSEEKRIQIFEAFKDTKTPHLGLFVLGGSFSEGMDFIGDLLKGVIIVGVGLPQVNLINNLEKDYFDNLFGQGFDYAYTYPGFTKVIQAAGRVIRSESDRGIVILIDERYLYNIYKGLMPEHWQNKKYIESPFDLKDDLVSFFNGGDNNG
jgi:DNA excision repair protein ERCC-2